MSKQKKGVDELPEEFSSYEEAAEFWSTHDTADYPEAFEAEPIEIQANFTHRRYEVELDEDLFSTLREKARDSKTSVERLVASMLRQQLATSS